MKDFSDKLAEFNEAHRHYSFEGDSGLEKFETILAAIGYEGHGFRFGSPIESFLSDNPGAVDALLEWIEDNACPEWEANLESHLEESEDEDSDEEE